MKSTTKVQRQASSVKSAAWVPSKEASTGGRPRYRVTKDQIETLRETGMSWKRIALTLGISDSPLYRRIISYEELYTVIMGMLTQTPYAGESYASGGLQTRGIFVQRH